MNGVPMTVFWNSYTITAATEDAVLEVRFKPRTFPPSNDTHTVTAFASPGGTISPEAVSYTHLDVYKRQGWKVIC